MEHMIDPIETVKRGNDGKPVDMLQEIWKTLNTDEKTVWKMARKQVMQNSPTEPTRADLLREVKNIIAQSKANPDTLPALESLKKRLERAASVTEGAPSDQGASA